MVAATVSIILMSVFLPIGVMHFAFKYFEKDEPGMSGTNRYCLVLSVFSSLVNNIERTGFGYTFLHSWEPLNIVVIFIRVLRLIHVDQIKTVNSLLI